tara:strand:+ start:1831 stop:2694 length:864 start_codon:yes stop_codon:yes gene_type:complete
MPDTNNQYPFFQKLILDIIPNFKWPLLVLVIWFLMPEDFGESFSKFAKDNNLKKLGIGTTVMELDPNKKIEEIKIANEKANTTENVAEALKNISKKADSEYNKELKKLAESLDTLTEQSAKIVNQNSKIFVPNENLGLSFNEGKKHTFNFEIYKGEELSVDISIGFDSLPFKYEFDLCDPSGYYKNLKSVSFDPNRVVTGLEYKTDKVDCKSAVTVAQLKSGSYMYAYDLKILNGFNIAKADGFDVFLPFTSNKSISNALFIPGSDPEVSSKYSRNKLVERTLVYVE